MNLSLAPKRHDALLWPDTFAPRPWQYVNVEPLSVRIRVEQQFDDYMSEYCRKRRESSLRAAIHNNALKETT